MSKNFLTLAFMGIFGFVLNLQAEVVRRAAFDFGSGCIRIHVADVDTKTHKVVNSLYTESVKVFLSEDLGKSCDQKFSEKIQETAVNTAKSLKEKALKLDAKEFYGIATAAYRSAENGEDLVKRYHTELSIHVDIISSEAEGRLSFLSLAKGKDLNPENIVCFDIGGGSFQITYMDPAGELKIYSAPYGRLTTKNEIITHAKHKNVQEISSPNPLSFEEWEKGLHFILSVLPLPPKDLLEKIKHAHVAVVGVAGHPPELADLGIYHKEDLLKLRDEYLNKSDQELVKNIDFFNTHCAVSDLILVHALMEKLEMNSISYFNNKGSSNSVALLISEELWNKP